MENSLYHHFLSQAEEGAEALVMPTGDRDRIGCFADQVKLTHGLIWDLDEAVKEVKLIEEHEEESSQKIIELEALCKKLRENVEKLKEEKTKQARLDRVGEDTDDEDDDDGGDAAAPSIAVAPPPAPVPLLPHLRSSSWRKTPWRWFPSMRPLWHMKLSWQMQNLNCRSPDSTAHSWGTMRKAHWGWWMTWMTRPRPALTWMSGFTRMEAMTGIESSSLSLRFRFKNKSLGFIKLIEL
jgi:hypothetical protein